jgi:hypothetical protein
MSVLTQAIEQELATLHTKWETEFPGHSAAIQSLREILIDADLAVIHSRAAYQSFHLLTETIGLGMHLWPHKILQRFHCLERRQSHSSRRFTHALQALQAATAFKSTPAKLPEKPADTPPVAPKIKGAAILLQNAQIKVIDGKVVTKLDTDAAFWCRQTLWETVSYVIRQMYFPDAIIPEPYAYVLAHRGVTYEPCNGISIAYSPAEFLRLCQLEVATNSEHLLDGERLGYERHENTNMKGLPVYEPYQREKASTYPKPRVTEVK